MYIKCYNIKEILVACRIICCSKCILWPNGFRKKHFSSFRFSWNFFYAYYYYTLAQGILISVRSLQRSEGFRPHEVYIFLISMTRRVDLAMSVCPSVSTQTSLSVLKLSGWNFPKSLISFAGSIKVGTSRIGQLYLIAPIGIIGQKNLKKLYLWCFLAYNLLSLEITFFN